MMSGHIVCIVIGCKGRECKMKYKFQGKRAELGVYDDWTMSDDSVEFIVPSPKILHDRADAERYSKLIDELNAIGCTSFILTAEEIKQIMETKFNNTNLMEEQNESKTNC